MGKLGVLVKRSQACFQPLASDVQSVGNHVLCFRVQNSFAELVTSSTKINSGSIRTLLGGEMHVLLKNSVRMS